MRSFNCGAKVLMAPLGLAVLMGSATPAPAAGFFSGVHVIQNSETQYGVWVDGNGPSAYGVEIRCKNNLLLTSETRWAGDSRGVVLTCPNGIRTRHVFLAFAPTYLNPQGFFTGLHDMTRTPSRYQAWMDGNGPDTYQVRSYCSNGRLKKGVIRWAGDRRGSKVDCAPRSLSGPLIYLTDR